MGTSKMRIPGFSPFDFLFPLLPDPTWALIHSFQPQKHFCQPMPYSSRIKSLGSKAILKYHSCLSSPLLSSQSKILPQFPVAELLGMRTLPKGWVELLPLCWLSLCGCLLRTSSKGAKSEVLWLCLPLFAQKEMACIDKRVCPFPLCLVKSAQPDGITELTQLQHCKPSCCISLYLLLCTSQCSVTCRLFRNN